MIRDIIFLWVNIKCFFMFLYVRGLGSAQGLRRRVYVVKIIVLNNFFSVSRSNFKKCLLKLDHECISNINCDDNLI